MSDTRRALSDIIRRMPKAELHCHLDGSLRPTTLHELATERGVRLPTDEPAELGDWMRVDDARTLEDYLARFDVTLSVMQDSAGIERVAYELVLDAAADGVRYIEIRFCPALSTRGALSSDDVMQAIIRGALRGEGETGTVARHIVCALRTLSPVHAEEMAELAIAHRGSVVAFDVAGAEAGYPASRFQAAFDRARNADMAITVHAGEGAGADSIRDAVHRCGADRIGHGTRLREDTRLMNYVIDRQIPLEVCPTSNVQTRVTRTFAEHPLAQYCRNGAVVTINTDNRLMSGVTLSDEYQRCVDHLGFTFDDLTHLSMASFRSAFEPYAARQRLCTLAARDIDVLRAEYTS